MLDILLFRNRFIHINARYVGIQVHVLARKSSVFEAMILRRAVLVSVID